METSLITSTCTRVPIRLKYYKVIFLFYNSLHPFSIYHCIRVFAHTYRNEDICQSCASDFQVHYSITE